MKTYKEIKRCSNSSYYLYILNTFYDNPIFIYENQYYLIRFILSEISIRNKIDPGKLDLKSLYKYLDDDTFYIYLLAYTQKDYVKSLMFSKYREQMFL